MPNYFPMLYDLILQMARSTPENTCYCVVFRIGVTHWEVSIPMFLITYKSRGIFLYDADGKTNFKDTKKNGLQSYVG